MAPKRQEKGKRISAPGDVNSRSDDDFAAMASPLTCAPKRQEKGKLHTSELPQVAGTSRNMLLFAPKSGK